MATLHIEHHITDFDTWASAYRRFADARRQAGVREERIHRPVDDPHYVIIDLGFASADEAAAFCHFLQTRIWTVPANAPALVGSPRAIVLEPATIG